LGVGGLKGRVGWVRAGREVDAGLAGRGSGGATRVVSLTGGAWFFLELTILAVVGTTVRFIATGEVRGLSPEIEGLTFPDIIF
jgi:hypothetical protein